MNAKNIALLSILGAAYLALAMLVVQVHPGAIVGGFGLPALTGAITHEVD